MACFSEPNQLHCIYKPYYGHHLDMAYKYSAADWAWSRKPCWLFSCEGVVENTDLLFRQSFLSEITNNYKPISVSASQILLLFGSRALNGKAIQKNIE